MAQAFARKGKFCEQDDLRAYLPASSPDELGTTHPAFTNLIQSFRSLMVHSVQRL